MNGKNENMNKTSFFATDYTNFRKFLALIF